MAAVAPPEVLLDIAIAAWKSRISDFPGCLDDLPAPLYVTDVRGVVTLSNKACVGFAGRVPVPNHDRWCVSWKLWTDQGAFLPHDQCPMATAVRERRPVRGLTAVAERPDGTKVAFRPYPTPLFDTDGAFIGAINLLLDITLQRRRERLRADAARCRRLAASIGDMGMVEALSGLAREYDAKADALSEGVAGND